VLVSAFTTRGLSADLFRLVVAEHELLTGEVNLTEFRRVLRQRFKVPPGEAAPSHLALRDPDDAWVRAEILVTGDKDLLSVAERATLPIVDPRSWWDRLRRLR
jgi:hypothetical protein